MAISRDPKIPNVPPASSASPPGAAGSAEGRPLLFFYPGGFLSKRKPLEELLKKTAALGGTELLLVRTGRDWSNVRGTAYYCANRQLIPPFPTPHRRSVVTAKG